MKRQPLNEQWRAPVADTAAGTPIDACEKPDDSPSIHHPACENCRPRNRRCSTYSSLAGEPFSRSSVAVPAGTTAVGVVADGTEYVYDESIGDDRFEGGELEPGATETGRLAFEIPADATDVDVIVAVAFRTDATWSAR